MIKTHKLEIILIWLSLCLLFGEARAADPIFPDHRLTPGTFDVNATVDKICQKGYTGTVRYVTEAQKNQVFEEYHIQRSGEYEVDHLISLELGGSNDTRNLWPQSYRGDWNARIKDIVENRLHYLVCSGKLNLRDAQLAISTNWIQAYCKHVPTANCKGI